MYPYPYSPFVAGLRWVFFHMCAWVFWSSVIANLLPPVKNFSRHPRWCWWYEFVIDLVAFFALNIRADLPSIEVEAMGFRRKIRHGYRNWQQRRIDGKWEKDNE